MFVALCSVQRHVCLQTAMWYVLYRVCIFMCIIVSKIGARYSVLADG